MAEKKFWIRAAEGAYAIVEGAAARDQWTKVRGWAEAGEPGPTDQVHVVNADPAVGAGRLPYGALGEWSGLGWSAGPPPEPVDTTKDSVLVDQSPAAVVEPAKPKTQAAAGGSSS